MTFRMERESVPNGLHSRITLWYIRSLKEEHRKYWSFYPVRVLNKGQERLHQPTHSETF